MHSSSRTRPQGPRGKQGKESQAARQEDFRLHPYSRHHRRQRGHRRRADSEKLLTETARETRQERRPGAVAGHRRGGTRGATDQLGRHRGADHAGEASASDQSARHPCGRNHRCGPEGTARRASMPAACAPTFGSTIFACWDDSLEETEFAIIAALQYIRYVNERHSYITIHGANLSLSIPHNVRNFACGKHARVQRMRTAREQRRGRGRGRRQPRLPELRNRRTALSRATRRSASPIRETLTGSSRSAPRTAIGPTPTA